MARIIRQEVNLIVKTVTVTNGVTTTYFDASVPFIPGIYPNATFYFEVLAKVDSNVGTNTVKLYNSPRSLTDVTLSITSTTPALVRSVFTPTIDTDGQNGLTSYYNIQITAAASRTVTVYAARIVIIQSGTTIPTTATYIEMGSISSITAVSTAPAALTNPKYWKYVSANWDSNTQFRVFFNLNSQSTKVTATGVLQVADGTGDGFAGWSNVLTIGSSSGGYSLVDGGYFTPVADRNYRIAAYTSNSKSAILLTDCWIIATNPQAGLLVHSGNLLNVIGGSGSSGETNQQAAQPFTVSTNSVISGVTLFISKRGSPADSFRVDIVSALGGSSLASGTIAAGSIVSTTSSVTFTTPLAITAGTTYYIVCSRTGALDATNYYQLTYAASAANSFFLNPLVYYTRSNNSWSQSSSGSLGFRLVGAEGVKLIEAQYMLGNTLAAAGTALQSMITKWDSTEWATYGNVFKTVADAANNSTSVAELDTAAGVQIASSIVTSPDNQGFSSAIPTMPANGNIDYKVTTNNNDVYAVRLLNTPQLFNVSTQTISGVAKISAGTISTQTISGTARITANTTKTTTGTARITNTTTKTTTGTARIKITSTQTTTGTARITAATAKTTTGTARITANTTKTISGTARVTVTTTRTISGVAKISILNTQTITGTARIQKSVTQTIAGTARITANTTKTVSGTARITVTTTKTQTGIARVQKSVTQTTTGTARIQKSVTQTTTGIARITNTATKTISGTARIKITSTQTTTGTARITASAIKTVSGAARITANTPQTITGTSRITASTVRTVSGTARIQKSATQTISGVANIFNHTAQTISGTARITANTTQTIAGKSRITVTTTKTQTGTARIQISSTQATTGTARITVSTTQTISGIARIAVPGISIQTISGTASIKATTTKTISGTARIQKPVSETISGTARISVNTDRTISGTARITSSTVRTQTGTARITSVATQTMEGTARVSIVTTKTVTGAARITATTTKTISGTARITANTTHTISGTATILITSTQTISGQSRIEASTVKTISGTARIFIAGSGEENAIFFAGD